MLDFYLRDLGLEERETAVLLALAQQGELSAGEVQEKTSIPRSSLYLLLRALIEKGMIVEFTDELGTTSYQLAGPAAFSTFVEKERERFQKKENAGKSIAELLAPSASDQIAGVPRIRFYAGKRDIERMLWDGFSSWRESIRQFDTTWWGFQDHHFVDQYRRWLEMIWKSTADGERVRLFSNETGEERERNIPGRRLKFFPADSEVTSTIWVLGDFVIMIYSRGKPNYAFQFHDRIFAANLRQVFKSMWGE